jgi:1,4-alpha-glucan branching enzyme
LRVVVLTWEYPPRIVGELGAYVQTLCQGLTKRHIDTHVVTYNEEMKGIQREPSGVIVHRVGNPVPTHLNVLTWVLTLSEEFERVIADIHYETGAVDLIDCHEWISVPAATSLNRALRIPYIMTIESLEEQRSVSPENPMSLTIKYFERLGTGSSRAVIVKSTLMKEMIQKLHDVPRQRIHCVPRNRAMADRVAKILKDSIDGTELVLT